MKKSGFTASGISKFIRESMDIWKVPGAAVGIIKEDSLLFSEGFGIRGLRNPKKITANTLFAIASCTKAFTSLAIAIAVEEKKIDWNTPVQKYMPDFRLKDQFASERITPRDLLCHCSGLPRHDDVWWKTEASREDMTHRIRYLEPSKDFRTVYQYQNLMFMVAGYLIERVYGVAWEDFVQERILAPLGMVHTNFSVEDVQKTDDYAYPHFKRKEKITALDFCPGLHGVGPAGSMNSNVVDMLKWVSLHLDKGKVGDTRIISEEQIVKTHTPQIVVDPSGFEEMPYLTYAMGWHPTAYRGRRLLYHGGNVGGFSCNTAFMPDDKIGIVVLTNLSSSNLGKVVTYHVLDVLLNVEPTPWNDRHKEQVEKEEKQEHKKESKRKREHKKGTKPSHALESYVGEYNNPGYGSFRVWLENGQLMSKYNTLVYPLEHHHYDVFERVDKKSLGRTATSFHTSKSGEIESVSVAFEPEVADILFVRVKASTGS